MSSSPRSEEEEGENLPMHNEDRDSSEEDVENSDEERKIREGFIIESDEDLNENDKEVLDKEERRRRKKKKRKLRRAQEMENNDDEIDEDDLDLIAENTGKPRRKESSNLRRLHRRTAGTDDEDLDADDNDLINDEKSKRNKGVSDLINMFNDEPRQNFVDDDYDDDDMGNFIEEDEEESRDVNEGKEARRKRKKQRQRKTARGMLSEQAGIDQETMDEVYEVFGDGTDYAWAMDIDDEEADEEMKADTKMADIFEPSEIKARLLTDEDEMIRYTDLPERMQLLTPGIAITNVIRDLFFTNPENYSRLPNLEKASTWIAHRLSASSQRLFLDVLGEHYILKEEFIKAINNTIEFLVDGLEVPFIHTHRRDRISYFDPTKAPAHLAPHELRYENPAGTAAHWRNKHQMSLLSRSDIWNIHLLFRKYISLHLRIASLRELIERSQIKNDYLDNSLLPMAENETEFANDVHEWILGAYPEEIKIYQEEQRSDAKQFKRPSKSSSYERAKRMGSNDLIKAVSLNSNEIALNLISTIGKIHNPPNPELEVFGLGEVYASGPISGNMTLQMAKLILSTDIGRDPIIKKFVRDKLTTQGIISVSPTDKGLTKIDDQHSYNRFLYLKNKPIEKLTEESTQFLSILSAEREDLITVSIGFHVEVYEEIVDTIHNACKNDGISDVVDGWNEFTREAIFEAFSQFLMPSAIKYTREWLREKQEDYLAHRCTQALSERIEIAPFTTPGWEKGEIPSVLAVSAGQGDPRKDAIMLVFMDENGRLREQQKIDNLIEESPMEAFGGIIQRRQPQLVVVGGMGTQTHGLYQRITEMVRNFTAPESQQNDDGLNAPPPATEEQQGTPVIFVHDDIARIYQHSKRAEDEFGELPLTGKYCIGLARYAQSPINEFAALGEDITAISIDPEQRLLPHLKFLGAVERAFVNTVNHIGVDINIAVRDTHYQHLLQYVAGLGPRKAQALVRRIASRGGYIINRSELANPDLMYLKEFTNSVAFLKITHEFDTRESQPDVLDQTRIHPENYDLARKMASDALELDEEDVEGQHESAVVQQLMKDPQNESKLDELNLDDYALNLLQQRSDSKRSILSRIRNELLDPYSEDRDDFKVPNPKEIFTMLTGETEQTLSLGTVVPAVVKGCNKQTAFLRLDSGVEAFVNSVYATDEGTEERRMDSIFPKGQTIQGMVLNIDFDIFTVELSTRSQDLAMAPEYRKIVAHDEYYDESRAIEDRNSAERRKTNKANRTPRVVDHPNFHNFSAQQAEQLLETHSRGEVIIRPSSKGPDHLVVTWKVDEDLYQHIDVLEIDKVNEWSLGRILRIGNASYTDLDEMLVMHVQPMVRKVEELINHEKYHGPTEDDMAQFLQDFVKANPNRSNYAFCLDRTNAGSFVLGFLASERTQLNRWSVQVTPGMYILNGAQLPTVADLCRAFKMQYMELLKNPTRLSARTPFIGGRTPAVTPFGGSRTPAAAWGGGRTPGGAKTPGARGGRTPAWGGKTPKWGNGSRTPAYHQQPANNWDSNYNNDPWNAGGYNDNENWNTNTSNNDNDGWNTSTNQDWS